MPDLLDRLFPSDTETTEKIAVHYFRAALGDYSTGNTSRNQIVGGFSLDADAQTDLDVLLAKIDGFTNDGQKALFLLELHDVLMIAESGKKYTTKADLKTRLGL